MRKIANFVSLLPNDLLHALSDRFIPPFQMDQKRNWVLHRPHSVDRLQRVDAGARMSLYKGLETILQTKPEPTETTSRTSVKISLNSTYEDSALGVSLDGETLNSPSVKRESIESITSSDEDLVPAVGVGENLEELKLPMIIKENGLARDESDSSDLEQAEAFHAALGPEIDVIRQQIASIINEGFVLFPLELVSQLYLRYGRRLPLLNEEFSTDSLLNWLKRISCLKLDNLILGV
ncbi:uncharacterized protein LOC100903995 [Galendromus occidentalis]|uniref:Uncharacterized protein LOC100903995 n=1 Tax=Galendromus occidentalis TaxID=34638 RepID=A0AAJ7PA49_9ACAR|nr:uncharacterized protein LOC100903995 [Galendromus occidentalis]